MNDFLNSISDLFNQGVDWLYQLTKGMSGATFAILSIVVAVVLSSIVSLKGRKQFRLKIQEKSRLKKIHSRDPVYLCDGVEEIDYKGTIIQFSGEPFGTVVRPGMKVTDPRGIEYAIKEVYNNRESEDEALDKPDAEIQDGELSTIVIETKNFNFTDFQQRLSKAGAIALKLR